MVFNNKYFLTALIFCLIISCKDAKDITIKEIPKSSTNQINKGSNAEITKAQADDNKLLKKILKKQLEKGKSALYNNSFDIVTYKFDSEDFEVTLPVLKQKLSTYIVPSKEEFKQKINEIFGRTINSDSNSKYLYVNLNNKDDRQKKYFRNDNSIEIHPFGIFVVKEGSFITSLYAIPEIVDYKNKYPEIFKFEKKIISEYKNEEKESMKIYKWMDEADSSSKTIKTFIARNKYLFNNDKSQLDWLLQNDEEFMESLIKTFNYSKDQKHRNWFKDRP